MPIELEDPTKLPDDFVVFYCWQSHLDSALHRYLIRDALQAAIQNVQSQMPEDSTCNLRFDSDTTGRAGSNAIAHTILEKLRTCSAVIADVTPVLRDEANDRYYPNPNVMFELGYAAHCIGWNRVLPLYNSANSVTHEKLPFDIRHRQSTPYTCVNREQRNEAKKDLTGKLTFAIRTIVQEVARGVMDPTLGDRALKRGRDLRLLKDLMATINTDALDSFISSGMEHRLIYETAYYWYHFSGMTEASGFRFYDQELEQRVRALQSHWGEVDNYGAFVYAPNPHSPGQYSLMPEQDRSPEYRDDLNRYDKALLEMQAALRLFIMHVHDQYPEIDRDETNRRAWEAVRQYLQNEDGQ